MLFVGLAFLLAADVVLAGAPAASLGVTVGIVLWGLHMAFTQGLFATLVADAAPRELRGTAFGVFNLVSGGALLIASLIAGGALGHGRPGRHVRRRARSSPCSPSSG